MTLTKENGVKIIRIGIGLMFIGHGLPKVLAGPEMWAQLGGAMSMIGISFAPAFWGLMAALAELLGGAALVLGVGLRFMLPPLMVTMLIASIMHLMKGDGFFQGASHAIESLILFTGMFFMACDDK